MSPRASTTTLVRLLTPMNSAAAVLCLALLGFAVATPLSRSEGMAQAQCEVRSVAGPEGVRAILALCPDDRAFRLKPGVFSDIIDFDRELASPADLEQLIFVAQHMTLAQGWRVDIEMDSPQALEILQRKGE